VTEPADAIDAGSMTLPHDDLFDRILIAQSRRRDRDLWRRNSPACAELRVVKELDLGFV